MEGKTRGSNSWAEAIARSCGDADRAPQGIGFTESGCKSQGRVWKGPRSRLTGWIPQTLPLTQQQEDHQHNQSARGWAASGQCIGTTDRGPARLPVALPDWVAPPSSLHTAPQQTSQIDYRAPSPRARASCSANSRPNQSDSKRCGSGSRFYTPADDNEPM